MTVRSVLEFSPGAAGPLLEEVRHSSWRSRAICCGVDPDLFFCEGAEDVAAAKLVCQGCPVRRPCLLEALEGGVAHGVWGGLTADERRGVAFEAPPARGPQRCPKGRHVMTPANTGADGRRCLACRNESEARKRETERVIRTGSSSPQSGRRAA